MWLGHARYKGRAHSMVLAALVAAALGALGCEADLVEAIDELRAAAPTVCKDYCEDKLACEWPTAEGVEEEAAFSEGVERCTVDCAFYMGKGAYVVRDGVEMVEYFDSVSGSTLLSALECAMENGTFRCTEGDPNDVHVFGGIVESMCEDADECLDLLDIDQHLEWIPSPEPEGGGTCVATGDEWIDADFFLP